MLSQSQIQLTEQRSIALFHPNEGPQSLPLNIDRSVFVKNAAEKQHATDTKNQFKHNGLFEWNERNRPGNNRR